MASAASSATRPATRTKQKHVTTACMNCRTRKIKCDASTPSCSNCLLYSQPCIYQHGLDKRKTPIKERLLAVEAYAKQLETLLLANGIPLPQERGFFSSTPTEQAFMPAISPSRDEQSDHAWNTSSLGANSPPIKLSSPSPDVSSPLVDQLAGNLGSLQIAEDGQLRFYGATSNLHLLVTGARQPGSRIAFPTSEQVQATLNAAGVGHHVEQGLEDHLIKLYFCWEDPSIHVVREDIFYRERTKAKAGMGTSRFYSEVLVNSMCAVGASLTPRHCIELPESLVDFFTARARALLDVEMDSPTLSTVQSLVILSGVGALLTLDARGWLYSGMAVRLATDLGLHLNMQAYVDAGFLDAEEALLRRVVFWGAFIHERMWSLYMGRPVSLDEKTITVPEYVPVTEEQRFWQPYVDDFENSNFPRLPDPIEELHNHNATLCAKMTRIRETLYSDAVVSTLCPQELHDFAHGMREELLEWHVQLPTSLFVDLGSVSEFYVPHVLQLHMQYHCVMILVNRPFFAATIATYPDVAFSDPMVGRPACTESARALSKLLHNYRRLYGFRRINIQAVHLIFTASLIHVLNACQATEPSLKNSAWNDLEVCCQALTEMGQGYKNATRALEVVNGIKGELLKVTRENAKRNSAGDGLASLAKRRRPSTWEKTRSDEVTVEEFREESALNATESAIETLFWSEFTSLDLPGL
jgi:hypothetical protein